MFSLWDIKRTFIVSSVKQLTKKGHFELLIKLLCMATLGEHAMALFVGVMRRAYKVIPQKSPFCIRNFSKTTSNKGFTGFKISDKLYTRQAAQDFIFKLNHRERNVLLDELQRFQSQAAAIQEAVQPEPPTSAQLRAVASHNAMPFIGFGFLDNFIMIIAGDYIDATIGLTLGITTMAAAGLGNTLSDVAGIGSAYYVERFALRIGVKAPVLTPVQLAMARTRWCANLGRALGVIIGCLLGMSPLLFLPAKDAVIETKETN